MRWDLETKLILLLNSHEIRKQFSWIFTNCLHYCEIKLLQLLESSMASETQQNKDIEEGIKMIIIGLWVKMEA